MISGRGFFDLLYERVPAARKALDEHLECYGELLLHLIAADIFRLALDSFTAGNEELTAVYLEAVDEAFARGNGAVLNAVAVSFVEGVMWWPEQADFFSIWPDGLKAEAERQAAWRPRE